MGSSAARPFSVPATGAPGDRRRFPRANERTIHHLGTDDRSAPRVRIVDATLRCFSQQGTHKTTVDDIAKEARLSRATVYRVFPGGKEAVIAAVVETEVARFYSSLGVAMGNAKDLEEALVSGIVEAARTIKGHRALGYMFEYEPGVLLPCLAFGQGDKLLLEASRFAAPFFGRWLEPEQASRAAEWAVRIVMTYVLNPSDRIDLGDVADTRHLVKTFVLPGIQTLRAEQEARCVQEPRRDGEPLSVSGHRVAQISDDRETKAKAKGSKAKARASTAKRSNLKNTQRENAT